MFVLSRENNDEFGIDFENIMEEGAANGMNDNPYDDAADDDWINIYFFRHQCLIFLHTCIYIFICEQSGI